MRECRHSKAASEELTLAFRKGIRLSVGLRAGALDWRPCCAVCGDIGVICCLACNHISCRQPKHGLHLPGDHKDHNLGIDISTGGSLHCFNCGHAVFAPRFCEVAAQEESEICLGRETSAARDDLKQLRSPKDLSQKQCWHASTGLRGFVNMGATCYVSVVLQSLLHNPMFQSFFLAGGHDRTHCPTRKSGADCVQCCMDTVVSDVFAQPSVSGYGLQDLLLATAARTPSMTGAAEQDAHEYLHFVLGEIHRTHFVAPAISRLAELAGEKMSGPATDLEDCTCVSHRGFASMLQSTLSCGACGAETLTLDPAMDLSLEVTAGGLQECLSRFTSPERLAYYVCSSCGARDTVTKQILIHRLPPILHIQLKRFKHSGLSSAPAKLEQGVEFELQLDMSPYCAEREKLRGGAASYDLFAVVQHSGTLDTGHYTCMVKHAQTGLWFRFDDQMITQVSTKLVLDPRAYLLFYAARWTI